MNNLNYDIIKFDAGDVRNKTIVDQITKHNMSDKNVLSLMQKKTKKILNITYLVSLMCGKDFQQANGLKGVSK